MSPSCSTMRYISFLPILRVRTPLSLRGLPKTSRLALWSLKRMTHKVFSSMSTPVKQPDPAVSPSEDAAHRSLLNFFLSLPVVPSCFKSSVIVCVPRKSKVICLNDCHPVLHLSYENPFEMQMKYFIPDILSPNLDLIHLPRGITPLMMLHPQHFTTLSVMCQ